jgi:hypothetical protein
MAEERSPFFRALDFHSLICTRLFPCLVPSPLVWNTSKSRMEFNVSGKRVLYTWIFVVGMFLLGPLGLGSGLIKLCLLKYSPPTLDSPSSKLYMEFGVSLSTALFSLHGFGFAISILYCGSDLASSFNALIESERNCGLPFLENWDKVLRKQGILMASLSLVNVWWLWILPVTVSGWLVYSDLSPNAEIFKFLLKRLNMNNPYLCKFLSFIYLWIGLTEFLRLMTILGLFCLIVPLTMNSVLRRIQQQACFTVSVVGWTTNSTRHCLKLYNEQKLILYVMSTGISTTLSIGLIVGMILIVQLNFATIRLHPALPNWILICALFDSLMLTILEYIIMASFGELVVNSTELIRMCRNSSKVLLGSKRCVHKTCLALRPLGYSVGMVGYNFKVIDRSMSKGYNVKIMDYTIVILLATP